MARLAGELMQWDDEKGFGFIRADGQRYFVHISSIRRIATRPRIGDRVSFALGRGKDGRPAAIAVEIAGANPVNPAANRRGAVQVPPAPINWLRAWGAGLIVLLAFAAVLLGRVPSWLPIAYLMLGLTSIAIYWADKSAAEADRWRVRELALHGIDLIGGIAGGLIAQQLLRHKTAKPGFIGTTFAITLLHVAGLIALLISPWVMSQL